MGTRVSYPVEVKQKAVEMRLAGVPMKEIMQELNIKNKTQVQTWVRWHKAGDTHRFEQPVGKQYSYVWKGPRVLFRIRETAGRKSLFESTE